MAEDSWSEFARVAIIREGDSSAIELSAITEEISMEFGSKAIEGKATVAGGRVTKRIPMGDESITLKVYPTDADISGDGVVQFFHPQDSDDELDPISVTNTNKRLRYKLVILWAEEILDVVSATSIPATGAAERLQIIDAWMTDYKLSFEDKHLSAEVTFTFPPFKKDRTGRKKEESTKDSATGALPAVTLAYDTF